MFSNQTPFETQAKSILSSFDIPTSTQNFLLPKLEKELSSKEHFLYATCKPKQPGKTFAISCQALENKAATILMKDLVDQAVQMQTLSPDQIGHFDPKKMQ
jgi:hypothetical protein